MTLQVGYNDSNVDEAPFVWIKNTRPLTHNGLSRPGARPVLRRDDGDLLNFLAGEVNVLLRPALCFRQYLLGHCAAFIFEVSWQIWNLGEEF